MKKTESQELVKIAVQEAFAAGKKANKMEHERNVARHKRALTKARLKARIKELEGTLKAASDEVVKLTVERDQLREMIRSQESPLKKALDALPAGSILVKQERPIVAQGEAFTPRPIPEGTIVAVKEPA